MKSIRQSALSAFLLVVPVLLSVQSANAQAITIQSAAPNSAQTALTITGSNFCASPTVTLGGTALTVTNSTSTQITATLPAMTPSTYYMVVFCGTLAGRTVYFDVTIGTPGASSSGTTAAGGCWVNGQRYADCGNGTVTDSATGLIWLKDANCAMFGAVDFATANSDAAQLHSGQCGLTDGSAAGDWRLPSRAEWLATLQGPRGLIAQFVATCSPAPPLKANDGFNCFASTTQGSASNQHAFLNVVTGGYWSSSTYEIDPTYAYLADLSVKNVSDSDMVMPHFLINGLTLNVWPVRSGSK